MNKWIAVNSFIRLLTPSFLHILFVCLFQSLFIHHSYSPCSLICSIHHEQWNKGMNEYWTHSTCSICSVVCPFTRSSICSFLLVRLSFFHHLISVCFGYWSRYFLPSWQFTVAFRNARDLVLKEMSSQLLEMSAEEISYTEMSTQAKRFKIQRLS